MTNNTLYTWVDLETNGRTIANGGAPFEIACIVTDSRLDVLEDEFQMLVYSYDLYEPNKVQPMPDVVWEMHQKSGLWEEYSKATQDGLLTRTDHADIHLSDYLRDIKARHAEYTGSTVLPDMILAGSGVSHFDSRWMKKFFPDTWMELKGFDPETKPTIDLGVFRRYMQEFVNPGFAFPYEGNHRALDDVKSFIANARWLAKRLNFTFFTPPTEDENFNALL